MTVTDILLAHQWRNKTIHDQWNWGIEPIDRIGALMPAKTTCVRCRKKGFVRTEHIIKGGAALIERCCGSCGFTWRETEDGQRVPSVVAATDAPAPSGSY